MRSKKIMALILSGTLALSSFAACGGEKENKENKESKQKQVEEDVEDDEFDDEFDDDFGDDFGDDFDDGFGDEFGDEFDDGFGDGFNDEFGDEEDIELVSDSTLTILILNGVVMGFYMENIDQLGDEIPAEIESEADNIFALMEEFQAVSQDEISEEDAIAMNDQIYDYIQLLSQYIEIPEYTGDDPANDPVSDLTYLGVLALQIGCTNYVNAITEYEGDELPEELMTEFPNILDTLKKSSVLNREQATEQEANDIGNALGDYIDLMSQYIELE